MSSVNPGGRRRCPRPARGTRTRPRGAANTREPRATAITSTARDHTSDSATARRRPSRAPGTPAAAACARCPAGCPRTPSSRRTRRGTGRTRAPRPTPGPAVPADVTRRRPSGRRPQGRGDRLVPPPRGESAPSRLTTRNGSDTNVCERTTAVVVNGTVISNHMSTGAEQAAAAQQEQQREPADDRREHERQQHDRAQDAQAGQAAAGQHGGERTAQDDAQRRRDRGRLQREPQGVERGVRLAGAQASAPSWRAVSSRERASDHREPERRGDPEHARQPDPPPGDGLPRDRHGAANPACSMVFWPCSPVTSVTNWFARSGCGAFFSAAIG